MLLIFIYVPILAFQKFFLNFMPIILAIPKIIPNKTFLKLKSMQYSTQMLP